MNLKIIYLDATGSLIYSRVLMIVQELRCLVERLYVAHATEFPSRDPSV